MATNDLKKNKQDVIFFFGAGASVDASIPDTYGFAVQFSEHVKNCHSDLFTTLLKIIELREKFNESDNCLKTKTIDIEQLLDTLRRLTLKEKEPLLYFFEDKKFCDTIESAACFKLKDTLESFIREKVVVRDNDKLQYLRELLKFDTPLEIYSTNYDTCIEQLCYLTHRRYTDGFNIDWAEENFNGNYDIKHYKLHGSVIWFENVQTKQTVKIPAQAFQNGQPINLKLIYGEDIKPLLLYPAQKVEYVEPLTDLQLLFKHRLFDPQTKFVVFVGYSFKDEYVARMLWDAARVNELLHVFLISPNAQEVFESRIRYVNRNKKDPSRIDDRVICLPYTFKAVIPYIKNHYVGRLRNILEKREEILEEERKGHHVDLEWQQLIQLCIESEYITYAERIFKEKFNQEWRQLKFDTVGYGVSLCSKGLMHSLVTNDGLIGKWLERLNGSLMIFNLDELDIHATDKDFYIFFHHGENKYSMKDIQAAIMPIFQNYNTTLELLSPQFASRLSPIDKSRDRLAGIVNYTVGNTARSSWEIYANQIEDNERAQFQEILLRIPSGQAQNFPQIQTPEKIRNQIVLSSEKARLKKMFGGMTPKVIIDNP
jgi:hypothetical protein